MLTLNRVTKRYLNGYKAVEQVSLQLKTAEMAFLTGHSGAGKSTLLKLIACIESPTAGEIWFQGLPLHALSPDQTPYFRRNIGLIFQNPHLLPDRSVFDNVALPLAIAGTPHRDRARKVRAALDQVSLLGHEDKMPEALSGGEQQRVSIARAIVNKPVLILADEPTGNLDPSLAREIMRVFMQLNQFGVTALIASHHVELIDVLPYRKIHLHRGHIESDSQPAEVNEAVSSLL